MLKGFIYKETAGLGQWGIKCTNVVKENVIKRGWYESDCQHRKVAKLTFSALVTDLAHLKDHLIDTEAFFSNNQYILCNFSYPKIHI